MIVIADTSPINYLLQIQQIDVLQQLYAKVLIPPAVLSELRHPLAPKTVKEWAATLPRWIEIVKPKSALVLDQLDAGENEAIGLAIEAQADLILIDDQAGKTGSSAKGL